MAPTDERTNKAGPYRSALDPTQTLLSRFLRAHTTIPSALPTNSSEEPYFTRREGGRLYGGKTYEAIIRSPWKLLQNDPYSPLELYDIKDDPYETNDLAEVNGKIVNELSTALRAHIQRGGATSWQKPASRNE